MNEEEMDALMEKASMWTTVVWRLAIIICLAVLFSGCAAENCLKVDGAGIKLSVGCDTELQPVTRMEQLN